MKFIPVATKAKVTTLKAKTNSLLPTPTIDSLTQIEQTQGVRSSKVSANLKKKLLDGQSELQEDLSSGVEIKYNDGATRQASGATSTGTLYAQLEEKSTVSDVNNSSQSSAIGSQESSTIEVGTETSSALSTGAMIALGLIGVGAVGVAIASPSHKSKDTAAPQVTSITASSSAKTITLTYDEALDPTHLPLVSAFSITTNGVANTVSTISVNGNAMTLTLTNTFTSGALTITYTDPSTGNDVNAIQDTSGNDAGGFIQGIVADGYISGAQIYLDTNANGIADPSEATGIYTNSDGSFFLPNTLPTAGIIAVGGTNIDTGLAQTTPLKAPIGSSTINPLTTLVAALIDHAAQSGSPISAQSAAQTVATSLGLTLPTGTSLLNYDPLGQNDAGSLPAQKAAAQIATLVGIAADSDALVAKTIMTNWAHALMNPVAGIDLGDLDNLDSTELSALLANTNVSVTPTLVTHINEATTSIQNSTTFDGITSSQSQYLDTTAPAQITLKSSSNGIVKVQLDLAPLQTTPDSWSYSTNGGSSWTTGTGDYFKLAPGNYIADQIQVKQIDVYHRETISTIANGFTVAPNNELDKFEIDHTHSANWSYSTDGGASWTTGTGDSFYLPEGDYLADSVKVKELDTSGNTLNITTVSHGFNVCAPDLLAMSGGGFKALTADSGMLAGLLKYYNTDSLSGSLYTANDVNVADLLNDQMALSANSGSTWFLDLLGYSNGFVTSLNNYSAMFSKDGTYDLTTGGADGFFGVMGEAFYNYIDVSIADMWRDVQADFARISDFDSLATFFSDSPATVFKMLTVASHGLNTEVLNLLGSIPGVGPYINDIRTFLSDTTLVKISDAIDLMTLRGVDWNTFMQEIVFAPDNLATTLKDTNFYSGLGRTSTLETQSLIYTLTISSDEAAIGPGRTAPIADNTVTATVLNSEAQYEMFPNIASWLSPNATYNFMPASATSLGNPTDIAAPWLPSIKSGDLRVEYDSSKLTDWGTIKTYDDLSLQGLSAYMTSTISSAAAGVGASYGAMGDTSSVLGLLVNAVDLITAGNFSDPLLKFTKGLSPLIQVTSNANGPDIAYDPTLPSGTAAFADPITSTTSSAAATNGYLRMADGGYFDNTGLESGLSYLQANQNNWIANDGVKDFEITLFVVCDLNQIISPTLAARGFGNIGHTTERLFKDGAEFDIAALGIDLVDISHPNSAVFESAIGTVTGMAAPIWSYSAPNGTTGSGAGFRLDAWEMGVKTFAGNTMNIGAGYEGIINYWAIHSSTGAAPIASGNWSDYEIMYNQIINALQTQQTTTPYGTVTGAEILADHLGYSVLA